MVDIEQQAIQTYQLNMQYFQENHKELYELLLRFEHSLENGSYKQQYDLEYVNGGFDLKEIASGEYLYNKEPLKVLERYLQNVNFQKDISSITPIPMINTEYAKPRFYTHHALKYILELMRYVLTFRAKDAQMKEVIKFIFFGVELGSHIEPIHKKLDAHKYFFIEDNIEKFRYSLFVAKYYEIAKRSVLYFSVYEETEKFLQTNSLFLRNGYNFNYLFKFFHTATHAKDKLRYFINVVSRPEFMLYSYQLTLDRYVAPLKCLQKGFPLTNIYKKPHSTLFQDKPVLVIAAGPSLKKNIEWLSKNHHKYIIIAVSTVLNRLEKYNIVPDIVASLDAEELVKEYFENYTNKNFLDNSVVVFSTVSHTKVMEKVAPKNRFLYDVSMRFNSEGCEFAPSCVGSFAYLYALSLGIPEIYLLGIDLAVDQETGADHLDDYNRKTRKLEMDDELSISPNINSKEIPVKVAGNFKEEVFTTPFFERSVNTINGFAPRLKKDYQNIYNLSDGVKLAGAEPLKAEEMDNSLEDLDKKEFYEAFRTYMQSNTRSELSDAEKEMLQKDKNDIAELSKAIKSYENTPLDFNPDLYIHNLIQFGQELLDKDTSGAKQISFIYEKYFEFALNIIYDFFNTQGMDDVETHIVEINKIVLEGVVNITEQLEESLIIF